MSLDQALNEFHSKPSIATAENLNKIVRQQHQDGTLDDADTLKYIEEVVTWIVLVGSVNALWETV